ncbi:hypothetical protein EOA27_30385 [Mesorhizobium sp. M2A.F.Ca.ET.037.01.1.1]|uniref:hypothetical protein n=1 Tax=unclassified Mesorhizobium TaxID=325217 RepID=UPI000F763AC7|nr:MULTISPECIES: hypothetical protein [unclassified Mesorhizobium]RUY07716.1 hypothetical protein EOA25_14940 [Mesorhizobium sp. M2A.F.Ca.ET.040.01.1.1]RVC57987.1 hypothetical protein EN759_34935 [Mesorhizobium sp. M00.F.Ca.ET.038.03.1.1]AZO37538.1 hypothetical protein EJ072_26180 [Mesorhizobium sp. M2A.F.Ca.ET.046.03.2.1]RUX04015.1 hypothetical protein EOA27_30385 [Mesorhizobium sp. M2A.F.Ca.ET.037.01.1.1]RWA86553.1 MAG: hypothetical protein EOQ31_25650 [Mesorhizobium sp.]
MRALHLVLTATAMLAAGHASAASIDLSKPYGDKYGCINKNGQEVAADKMLLLTDKELITAASACTFSDKQPQADGSLVVTAKCEVEGEEGQAPTKFTIKRSAKNAKKLVVADEEGNVMGEVSRCK